MPLQSINIGSAPNDGTGDTARAAFSKVNDNFAELYAQGVIASTVTTDTTLTDPDTFVLVNAASGAVQITLPAAATGKRAVVKKTDASTNAVTVLPAGASTIDGDASVVILYQHTAVMLLSDGPTWWMA